ncbi:MAG: hypothetical protein LJE70_19985 [Chromatiaceae bacterium]|jgi:hypothetical protein|nr:hypothetical protein [Chromatiaceae bacterium]
MTTQMDFDILMAPAQQLAVLALEYEVVLLKHGPTIDGGLSARKFLSISGMSRTLFDNLARAYKG